MPARSPTRSYSIRILLAAILALLATLYWGLSAPSLPAAPEFRIPLAELRSQAREQGYADSVRVHVIAEAAMPAFVSTAWGGTHQNQRVFTAFEIFSQGRRIIVDAPHPPELHDVVPGAGEYFPDSFDAFQASLQQADRVIISHVHGDHVAGIPFGSDPAATARKLSLNPAQKSALAAVGLPVEPTIRDMGFPPALLAATQTLSQQPWQWLAPGVAVISTPGHTPGHQVVYVATAERELLLLGDMLWTLENIEKGRSRPRLISSVLIGEDAGQVSDQLAAIIKLSEQEPGILLVPSHDAAAVQQAIAAGALIPAKS